MTNTTSRAVASGAQSGMVLMIVATLVVPAGDIMSKYLATWMSPVEIAFYRFTLQALILGLTLPLFRVGFVPHKMWYLVLGGVMSAGTLVLLIGAFAVMPVATAIAIFFLEPLILTVLSVLLLEETAGWRRYIAIGVGMIGALIVIRPNWAAFGWPAIFPVGAAFCFAVLAISIRKLSPVMSGLAIQFWFSVYAGLALGVPFVLAVLFGFATLGFPTLDWSGMALIPAQALLSSVTFFMFTEAFRRTEASVLAPFQYIEIVGATVLGYLVFGDFPDLVTWLGVSLILASGLYVFRRERRQAAIAAEAPRG